MKCFTHQDRIIDIQKRSDANIEGQIKKSRAAFPQFLQPSANIEVKIFNIYINTFFVHRAETQKTTGIYKNLSTQNIHCPLVGYYQHQPTMTEKNPAPN